MWHYSEALEVNQKFFEVFTEEADRQDASYWETFIPHKAMVDLLDGLIRSLERGDAEPKSLWIHGPYGTGKTHAQFVLKHMLEDPWPDVEAYFGTHSLSKDLLKRLQAVRGRSLVVYRSSSASINSNQKFMAELQFVIKNALSAAGCHAQVSPILYDRVLDRVSGKTSAFDWTRAFDKHRNEFLDFDSAGSVAERLATLSDPHERLELMARIVKVMDQEGFFLLDDPETVKQWLKEVIQANELKWLILIWDEFTDFFINGNSLTGLQELAHLTKEAPFYLLLATHRSPETLQGLVDSKDWQKLLERFAVFHYEMEPVTAYRLMRNVVRPRVGMENSWEQKRAYLWSKASPMAPYLLAEGDRVQDLESLVPIHPYSAYLLSQVSRDFSSSQRTLFRFLKRSEKGSFVEFLQRYPADEWEWYTADSLWDYFFTSDNLTLPNHLKEVVSYYRSRERRIGTELERRALKATLLLLGLSRVTSGNPLLQPTLSNLRWIFFGTKLAGPIDGVMEDLGQRDLIRGIRLDSNDWQYTIPTGSLDRDAVQKYQKEFDFFAEARTKGGIGAFVSHIFSDLDDVAKRRQSLNVVSADELARRRARVIESPRRWETSVVIVVPKDEAEVTSATALARRLTSENSESVIGVLEVPFGKERWGNWCEDKATARWYKENSDTHNAVFFEDTALSRVSDWLKVVKAGKVRVFFRDKQMNAGGVDGFIEVMKEITSKRYPYRPERICATSTLYRENYGVKGAEIGLGGSGSVQAPYSVLIKQLSRQGLWPDATGFDADVYARKPEHPLSHMKAAVEKAFEGRDVVSVNELCETLQRPPFGLMPSPAGIMLIGLLLRDYVEGFYWHDGTNTRSLDRTKMAELINAVMKGSQQVTLSRTTEEARQFCKAIRLIFGLQEEETKHPENTREALRRYLTNSGYPIWVLKYRSDSQLDSLALLAEMLADTDEAAITLSSERISSLVHRLSREQGVLESLIREEPFEEAMRLFIKQSRPQLLDAASRVGITMPAVVAKLCSLMNEEVWLWKEAEVASRLSALQTELEMILALSSLLGERHTELTSAVAQLRSQLQQGKLPLVLLRPPEPKSTNDRSNTVGALLDGLQNLLEAQPGDPVDAHLATSLWAESGKVREAIDDRINALRRWVAQHLQTQLTPDEAAQLLEALPDLSQQSDTDTLKDQVGARLCELTRRKLMDQIGQVWQDISGSPSPDAWSSEHGVPIQWVLEGQPYLDLFTLVRAPSSRSEDDLSAALTFMNDHQQELAVLRQPDRVDDALLRVALGPYRELVAGAEDATVLRDMLVQEAGPNVYGWDRQHVAGLAQDWVHETYRGRIYPEVLRVVERAAEPELRSLVKELVKDPLVGARLLRRKRTP